MEKPITVYALNLEHRKDRRASICEQFANRPEFDLIIYKALELRNGPWALWQNFYNIVETEARKGSDYFIFCEDDHIFTEAYSAETLFARIKEARALDADILSGGMSVIENPVQVSQNLFWVSAFNGMQFTVIFNRLYERILSSKTTEGYVTDVHLSYLAKRKFVIYPYISIQREFGYSDATSINREEGRVTRFFNKTQDLLDKLYKIKAHYQSISSAAIDSIMNMDVSKNFIPTYLINLKSRADRLEHAMNQFKDRPEFQLNVVEACENEIGAVGLWQSICKIVRQAKSADEDVILICEDDHFFTASYDRETFLRQVMLAGAMGAQLLNGSVGGFGNLVQLPGNLYWTDWFWCTQFIVIYKCAYDTILNAEFTIRDVADGKLSSILTNKLDIVPFISEQTDFGYSDVTSANNQRKLIRQHFDKSKRCLRHYQFSQTIIDYKPSIYDESIEDCYSRLTTDEPHYLQLGCGHNLLPGWINTDVEPTYGAVFLDATQLSRIPDKSIDQIFAEHLFESFSTDKIISIFQECARILKDDGKFCFVIYSTEKILRGIESQSERYITYAKWNLANYAKGCDYMRQSIPDVIPNSFILGNFIGLFSPKPPHDLSTIHKMLSIAGFNLCNILEGTKLAHHNSYKPKEIYNFETLIIEAQKTFQHKQITPEQEHE